jgi:serine/threonine protein kinase
MLQDFNASGLKSWIESSLISRQNTLSSGYQGEVLIYREGKSKCVIKVPHGRGLIRYLHVLMLRHEYAVYRRLKNFSAVPECYGLVDNQYLVLEYKDARTFRDGRPQDETYFFAQLFKHIERMHQLGVAHMDLKKRDNLLVVNGREPCLIDFGAAVIWKPGFHPFNHFRYRLAVRFDYNAWIKLKYQNRFDEISAEDLPYYKKTLTEIVTRKIKRFYKDRILKLFRK